MTSQRGIATHCPNVPTRLCTFCVKPPCRCLRGKRDSQSPLALLPPLAQLPHLRRRGPLAAPPGPVARASRSGGRRAPVRSLPCSQCRDVSRSWTLVEAPGSLCKRVRASAREMLPPRRSASRRKEALQARYCVGSRRWVAHSKRSYNGVRQSGAAVLMRHSAQAESGGPVLGTLTAPPSCAGRLAEPR